METISGLVWFRDDLRISDNRALHFASQQCRAGITGLYIIDLTFLHQHDTAACRVDFILRGLAVLSANLSKLNIPLLITTIDHTHQTLPVILEAIQQSQAQALFFNRQYEIDEHRRDGVVMQGLAAENIQCYGYDDQLILPPGCAQTKDGGFYKIFTPYKRAWQKYFLENSPLKLLAAPKKQAPLTVRSSTPPIRLADFNSPIDPSLWPAGEAIARRRLQRFIEKPIFDYDQHRDFPALPGTSQLSPYLATGMISARQCFLAALDANHQQLNEGNPGAVTWMSELIWREFYKNLLISLPRLSMRQAYQLRTEKLPWGHDESLFTAWKTGMTGVPIVDAAMRQLNTIGWMHNRLRMITASFLVKNLHLDWRMGEKYFMQHLIDGDLAANNGGWQWSASTGVDAAPYFRVFNPIRQSQRFDPNGEFIRQYCPELGHLNNKDIHNPPAKTRGVAYPRPIVDVDKTRRQFIANYRKLV